MSHWLITGGTGLVGTRLRTHLAARGDTYTILTRRPTAPHEAGYGQLPELLSKADVVLNLAGENLFGSRWTDAVKARLVASRVETTARLVEAIRQADPRPRVLISASASGIYGDRGAQPLTESAAPADDFLARLCVDWEAAAAPAVALGVRVVNPRIGVVLDPAGGALQKMLPAFRLFGGGPLGPGTQWFPWIHRDDLCRMFIWMADDPHVAGPINAVAPGSVDMNGFAAALGRALRRPSWVPVPTFAVKLVAGESAAAVLASARVVPEAASGLGFRFDFPDIGPALTDLVG